MTKPIHGIHHITAISADPQAGINFYSGLLGLRLVKLTVNFDDPGTYHLYFGDAQGSPGSILTFFPYVGARPGKVGEGQVSAIAFSIASSAVEFWALRLARAGISAIGPIERNGRAVIAFADPDGLPLELVADDSRAGKFWAPGRILAEHAIRRFHGVTMAITNHGETAELLTRHLGLKELGTSADRASFRVGEGDNAQYVDLLKPPAGANGRGGSGTVHHIAWRCYDADQPGWRSRIAELGYQVTPIVDRKYFHSIYFREPGGVLFEIATDEPGFTVDQTEEALGSNLTLPDWLEGSRAQIELRLPPVKLPALT